MCSVSGPSRCGGQLAAVGQLPPSAMGRFLGRHLIADNGLRLYKMQDTIALLAAPQTACIVKGCRLWSAILILNYAQIGSRPVFGISATKITTYAATMGSWLLPISRRPFGSSLHRCWAHQSRMLVFSPRHYRATMRRPCQQV